MKKVIVTILTFSFLYLTSFVPPKVQQKSPAYAHVTLDFQVFVKGDTTSKANVGFEMQYNWNDTTQLYQKAWASPSFICSNGKFKLAFVNEDGGLIRDRDDVVNLMLPIGLKALRTGKDATDLTHKIGGQLALMTNVAFSLKSFELLGDAPLFLNTHGFDHSRIKFRYGNKIVSGKDIYTRTTVHINWVNAQTSPEGKKATIHTYWGNP
jgi:hypothetical protein